MTLESPFRWFDVGFYVHYYTAGCGRFFSMGVFIDCIVAEIFYEPGQIRFSVFDDGTDRRSQRGMALVRWTVRWVGVG